MRKTILFILLFSLCSSIVFAVPPTNYFRYWSGQNLTDVTGKTFININGVTLTDRFYFLDTSTQYLNTTSETQISRNLNSTISLWVNGSRETGTGGLMWNVLTNDSIAITSSSGTVRACWYNSTIQMYCKSGGNISTSNVLHHVLVAWNTTSLNLTLRVDNLSYTGTTASAISTTNLLTFGCSPTGTFCYNGTIQDIKLYNYTLTPIEQQELYSAGPELCIIPTKSMTLAPNTQYKFCPRVYNFTSASGNKIFNISNSANISVDCQRSTILSSNVLNYTYIFYVQGNNITIKNCILDTASVGVFLHSYNATGDRWTRDINISNNTFKNMGGYGNVFTDGANSFSICNNFFYNSTNLHQVVGDTGCHAVYVSSDVGNNVSKGEVCYNYIYNMSASGVKLNGADTIRNIRVYRNTIYDLRADPIDDYGVMLADVDNISVYENIFGDGTSYDSGIVLNIGTNTSRYPMNTKIYNNSFVSIVNAYWIKTNSTSYTEIYNNTYSNLNLELRMTYKAYFKTFYENATIKTGIGYSQRRLTLTNPKMTNVNITLY